MHRFRENDKGLYLTPRLTGSPSTLGDGSYFIEQEVLPGEGLLAVAFDEATSPSQSGKEGNPASPACLWIPATLLVVPSFSSLCLALLIGQN